MYDCEIEYNEKLFNSVEQAYQYTQANTLGCTDVAGKIMDAPNGREAMNSAKELPPSNTWDIVKLDVMKELVQIKMDSCQAFRDALLESGNKILAEATRDSFYGSGLTPDLTRCTSPSNYPGQNELGKLMMELRSAYYLSKDLDLNLTTAPDINHTPDKGFENMADVLTDVPSSQETGTEAYEKHKKELEAIEEEIRIARTLSKTTSACRSSSMPTRKPSKADDHDSSTYENGIRKYLKLKRQASTSPDKTDIQCKDKQIKI